MSQKFNIIFLDIDGVLNSGQDVIRRSREASKNGDGSFDYKFLCPTACSNLQWILEQDSSARIVVSSTWRIMHNLEELIKILKQSGVDYAEKRVIDITPKDTDDKIGGVRGDKIQAWLDSTRYVIKRFAIIDDDSDMAHLKPYLHQTNYNDGLVFSIAENITQYFLYYDYEFEKMEMGKLYDRWGGGAYCISNNVNDFICFRRGDKLYYHTDEGIEAECWFNKLSNTKFRAIY